jgi:hypothetical protein
VQLYLILERTKHSDSQGRILNIIISELSASSSGIIDFKNLVKSMDKVQEMLWEVDTDELTKMVDHKLTIEEKNKKKLMESLK